MYSTYKDVAKVFHVAIRMGSASPAWCANFSAPLSTYALLLISLRRPIPSTVKGLQFAATVNHIGSSDNHYTV